MIKQQTRLQRFFFSVKKLVVREGWIMKEISKDWFIDMVILAVVFLFAIAFARAILELI
jgi:hypothetical protein